jgi:CheY-like chemotaxis protein
MPSPFSFIDSTLNLLIIDDDPHSKSLLAEILRPIALFTVHTAASTSEALTFLRSGKRFHLCIMDLGISDVMDDEFYILRQYAHICSIIIVTGSNSPVKGATCIKLGARAVFEKGTSFNFMQLFDSIAYYTVITTIYTRFHENNHDTINIAVNVLFEKKPSSVTEWAGHLHITDRQLRNLWYTGSGFGAKYILYIFTLYSAAFIYYQKCLFGRPEDVHEFLNTIQPQKMANYFLSNQEAIRFILC